MAKKAYDTLIMTQLQLDILFNRMGYDEIYGIVRDYDETMVNKEEVYLAIAHMVKNGFLQNVNDKFTIDKKLKEALKIMAEATVYIHIAANQSEKQDYLCYISENGIVIAGLSGIRNNRIAVTRMSVEEFREDILEYSMPDNIVSDFGIEEEEHNVNIEINNNWMMEIEKEENKIIDLCRNGIVHNGIVWHCEIINKENRFSKDIFIFEKNLERYSVIYSDGRKRRSIYLKSEILELVLSEFDIIRRKNYGYG